MVRVMFGVWLKDRKSVKDLMLIVELSNGSVVYHNHCALVW